MKVACLIFTFPPAPFQDPYYVTHPQNYLMTAHPNHSWTFPASNPTSHPQPGLTYVPSYASPGNQVWPSAPPPCPTPVIPLASGGPPPSLDNLAPPATKCEAPSSKAAKKSKKSLKIPKKVVTSPQAVKPAKHSANFTAKELFEVVQAAIVVKFFKAKHDERGEREKEMGDMLRKRRCLLEW